MKTAIRLLAHATLWLAVGMLGCGSDGGSGGGGGSPSVGGAGGSSQGGTGGSQAGSGGSSTGTGGDAGTGGTGQAGNAGSSGDGGGTAGSGAAAGAAGTGGDGGAAGTGGDGGAAGTGGGVNPEAGIVRCGTDTCDLTSTMCCVGWPLSYTCKDKCGMLEAGEACDGPEDCSNGQACCAGFPSGSQCKAGCTGQDQEICHTNADCAGPKTCQDCPTPGGGPTARMCTEQCPY